MSKTFFNISIDYFKEKEIELQDRHSMVLLSIFTFKEKEIKVIGFFFSEKNVNSPNYRWATVFCVYSMHEIPDRPDYWLQKLIHKLVCPI